MPKKCQEMNVSLFFDWSPKGKVQRRLNYLTSKVVFVSRRGLDESFGAVQSLLRDGLAEHIDQLVWICQQIRVWRAESSPLKTILLNNRRGKPSYVSHF